MASLAPSGMIAIALLLLPVVVAVAVILALIWWTSREKPARDRRPTRTVRSNGSDYGFVATPTHHGHEHTPSRNTRDPDADTSGHGGHNGASSESGAGDSGGADAGGGDGGGGGGGD